MKKKVLSCLSALYWDEHDEEVDSSTRGCVVRRGGGGARHLLDGVDVVRRQRALPRPAEP